MRSVIVVILASVTFGMAQQPRPDANPGVPVQAPSGAQRLTPGPGVDSQAGTGSPAKPLFLDLKTALTLARSYSQQLLQAGLVAELAREDRIQAKAALFPTLSAFSGYLFTQGNGTPSGVFIANNGVHEYSEQATVHADLFSFTKRADYRRAQAAEAVARARQEISSRGLVSTIVQAYYALVSAQRHEANARRSVDEAQRFLDISEKLERGGEVAHADVIKAQLQLKQRQRDLMDAETNTQKARIALGVMLFFDLTQPYDISDDLQSDMPLPPLDEVRTLALSRSPEIRAAEAGIRQANAGVLSARAGYYPTMVLDYFFGIDANVFGIHGPEGQRNLGSVVQGSVTVPVWNWGSTRSKVRQAELQRRQSEFDLTFAQRTLQAGISSFYLEAQAARAQLDSLRTSLDLSVESLRLTILRYQAGESTALEVVDAQSTLALARNAYDDGLTRYRIALAALQTLTGTF
jgi:outer membrane protein TolC